MKPCLLFLNFVLFLAAYSHGQEARRDYAFEFSTNKAALTGVAVMREQGDSILGCMVNEFGVSAIDFIYVKSKDKVRLENLIGFLDKWYIKPTIKGDIRQCVSALYGLPVKKDKNHALHINGDTVIIDNTKRNLTYRFLPIPISNDDTE